ncbi:O-antigen ligase family protein [Nocardia arizonensis]|uniref:O-antigen ligase family protein n=1 Tax=Nocardia arizonensis TaxID=1141647 RepID=UPI0006CF9154|nr:O-antigen ligase family protein [Nocardia arizonensis]
MSPLGPAAAEAERPPRVAPRIVAARAVALLCLALVALNCGVNILPEQPIVWLLTPTRLAVLIGLIAVLATGESRWRTDLDIPLAVLLVASAAANHLAGQQWASWRGLCTVVAVYYLAVGVSRVIPDPWPAIVLLAVVGVSIAGGVAVQQVVQATPTGFCRGAIDGSDDICDADAMIRATGTFSNPNLLAAFLVLLLPIAAAGVAATVDLSARLLGVGLVALGYLAVIFTGSRAGVLAAIGSLVVFVLLRRLQSGRHPTVPKRLYVLSAAVVAVLAAGALFALVTRGGKVGVRADVWIAGVRIAGEHPLGVGPGRAGAYLNEETSGTETYQHAHNLWLNYAIEAGVLGMCAVVAITVIGIWTAVEASRRGTPTAPAVAAGLSAFVIMNLVDNPAANHRVAFVTAITLAVLMTRRDRPAPVAQPHLRPASMFDVTMPLPRITIAAPPAKRSGTPATGIPRTPTRAETA